MRRTGRAGGLAGLAFALFFCLLLAAAGEVKGGVTWKYCKGDWEASISNVTVLPDPVRAGQEINVLIDGEIGRVVEGGELDLKVIFHKIPVYKETDDLCDRLETCPANGAFTVDAKQKLPPFTLPVSRVNGPKSQLAQPRVCWRAFERLSSQLLWPDILLVFTCACGVLFSRGSTSFRSRPRTPRRRVSCA